MKHEKDDDEMSEIDELRQQISVLQEHNASLRLELTKTQCRLEMAEGGARKESGGGETRSARSDSLPPPRLEGDDTRQQQERVDRQRQRHRRSPSPMHERAAATASSSEDAAIEAESLCRLHRQYEGVVSLLEARNAALVAANAALAADKERLRLYANMLVVQESAKAGMVEAQRCTIEALVCLNASQAKAAEHDREQSVNT